MDQVTLEIFEQDTDGVMARVEHGETIEVTRHGRVIGRIVPATAGGRADLITPADAGHARPHP